MSPARMDKIEAAVRMGINLIDFVNHHNVESMVNCLSAGVRVVMITGDYPGTARNIARQIGLKKADAWITGPEEYERLCVDQKS